MKCESTTTKITKRRPLCGVSNSNRRLHLSDYRCHKCHKIFKNSCSEKTSLRDLSQLLYFYHSKELNNLAGFAENKVLDVYTFFQKSGI